MAPSLDEPPYTIDNLPYGVISYDTEMRPRCAAAIGRHAIDLAKYAIDGRLSELDSRHSLSFTSIFSEHALNSFAALPWTIRRGVRQQIQADLRNDKIPTSCLIALSEVTNHLPMAIGGYSDFYTSLEHCQNCSTGMTTSGIAKNWWFAPSVYNGRISSIVPTPWDIHRPKNVSFAGEKDSDPVYGPTRQLDYELEMGYFVSQLVPFAERMSIEDAKNHIFGFVLLNDWSARDHQLFEMRPLGPFHAKGFGTSISNWVVPMEALEPFACPPNTKQDPPPFNHLCWPSPDTGALDVKLRIKLIRNNEETVLATSNLKYMYWTPYQQLAHHAASGCGMRTGDLIGTGTISGSGTNDKGEKTELGCLYEAVQTGTAILPAGKGEYQTGYLDDGDEIILEGWCENGKGNIVLGFGECRGRILPPT